jgi:hypothetical protein
MTITINDTSPSDLDVLPHVELVSLAITVHWRRPTIIPGPVIANVLRGALGITFRRLVCPTEWMDHDCHPCPLYSECAYGQVFMPTPPPDASQLRLQQDLPRPFVIVPPGLDPQSQVTAEQLTFQLTLFGTAIDSLPYFITTLERLGHEGMGRDRMPFDVEAITARHPAGDETLFTHGSTTVRLPQKHVTTEDVLRAESLGLRDRENRLETPVPSPPSAGERVRERGRTTTDVPTAALPPSLSPQSLTLTLHFLTPTLLKTGSTIDAHGRHIPAREVRDRPPFGVIARRLRDRLSALCTFFGEPWPHPDFAALGRAADTVQLRDAHTTWLTRQRHSTRTGHNHETSGFTGTATYQFPNPETLHTFLPLLKLGQHLHLGKHAPWGNGRVVVMKGDAG